MIAIREISDLDHERVITEGEKGKVYAGLTIVDFQIMMVKGEMKFM